MFGAKNAEIIHDKLGNIDRPAKPSVKIDYWDSMSCVHIEFTSIVTLLLGLLWYIGGSPPVLREIIACKTPSLRTLKRAVNLLNLSKTISSFLIVMLVVDNVTGAKSGDVSDHSWCSMSLEEQVDGADIVARASVVSRSRVDKGHYYATFRIDKLLHVSCILYCRHAPWNWIPMQ